VKKRRGGERVQERGGFKEKRECVERERRSKKKRRKVEDSSSQFLSLLVWEFGEGEARFALSMS